MVKTLKILKNVKRLKGLKVSLIRLSMKSFISYLPDGASDVSTSHLNVAFVLVVLYPKCIFQVRVCLQYAYPLASVFLLKTHLNIAGHMIRRLIVCTCQLFFEGFLRKLFVWARLYFGNILDFNLRYRNYYRELYRQGYLALLRAKLRRGFEFLMKLIVRN